MKGDTLDTAMHTILAETTAMQIEYASTVVAYLENHPDITAAYLSSVECAEKDLGNEDLEGSTQTSPLGSYIVAFRDFLYPKGCSHGQWVLGMRRVNRYLKTGSYLEEWEIKSVRK